MLLSLPEVRAPPCAALARLFPLSRRDILGQQASHDHVLNHLLADKGPEAEGERVADGAGLARAAARVNDAADVDVAEGVGELEGEHDLVPLLQPVEVGDVLRVVEEVGVEQLELARAGGGDADLGTGGLPLAWKNSQRVFFSRAPGALYKKITGHIGEQFPRSKKIMTSNFGPVCAVNFLGK